MASGYCETAAKETGQVLSLGKRFTNYQLDQRQEEVQPHCSIKSHHIALNSPDFLRAKTSYAETLGGLIVGEVPDTKIIFIDTGGATIKTCAG